MPVKIYVRNFTLPNFYNRDNHERRKFCSEKVMKWDKVRCIFLFRNWKFFEINQLIIFINVLWWKFLWIFRGILSQFISLTQKGHSFSALKIRQFITNVSGQHNFVISTHLSVQHKKPSVHHKWAFLRFFRCGTDDSALNWRFFVLNWRVCSTNVFCFELIGLSN